MEEREREAEHVLELFLEGVDRRALFVGHLLIDLRRAISNGV